ncbi:hypothetical protein R3W88_013454 [Solanum pinnatisectum]|uniref:Uncharacterized protein n=1 Tax=Solanum pinnatisectum TaxID=50273 RepID=A0AAV9LBW2_9SOLN|nr:hypothetical protein R3W88_013454 [Solanum pinnatisectum]
MVDDRIEGEVDPSYLHWFFDQVPLKLMPKGSAIKQAWLEVERNYRSTLDILSNDLKNAREELVQRDAIFEEREHQSTIQTLHEDLGIVTGAMEQQEKEYKKENTFLMHTQMGERDELHNQIEELQAQEEDLNQTVGTTQEWFLIDVYGGYLHRSYESLGRHTHALAPHLPKALFKVYSSLGAIDDQEILEKGFFYYLFISFIFISSKFVSICKYFDVFILVICFKNILI